VERTIIPRAPRGARLGRRALVAAAIAALPASPALGQTGHSLAISGPATATTGAPVVLQATGTVSDDPSVFLNRYVNAYALPAGLVAACPPSFQNAIQLKDASTGQGGQTVALAVPVDGAFAVPLAFTSTTPGRFQVCGYLNDGVETDAVAAHTVTVAAAAGAAKPRSVRPPKVVRSGRTLTCRRGTWTRATRFAYAWRVDGRARAGATKRTLRVTAALEGRSVRCVVTARNAAGRVAKASAPLRVR
jgi:hypothetical protein